MTQNQKKCVQDDMNRGRLVGGPVFFDNEGNRTISETDVFLTYVSGDGILCGDHGILYFEDDEGKEGYHFYDRTPNSVEVASHLRKIPRPEKPGSFWYKGQAM